MKDQVCDGTSISNSRQTQASIYPPTMPTTSSAVRTGEIKQSKQSDPRFLLVRTEQDRVLCAWPCPALSIPPPQHTWAQEAQGCARPHQAPALSPGIEGPTPSLAWGKVHRHGWALSTYTKADFLALILSQSFSVAFLAPVTWLVVHSLTEF